MRKIKCYLSGGMQDISFEDSNIWREKISSYLWEFYPSQFKCFNPNDYWNFKNGDVHDSTVFAASDRQIINFDLYNLRNSDIVIVNFNSVQSLGTMAELAIAYELRKPIIGINIEENELHPWQREMCDVIFTSWAETAEYVGEHYS